jgi:hypothetical protein
MTFGELALHYAQHELLNDQCEVVPEETRLTIRKCRGYLVTWILPRWERVAALAVIPSEVEKWLKEIQRDHHIENATLSESLDVFPLLRADRLRTHLRVFFVLVEEHHHRDEASAVLFVVHKLSPAIVPHVHAAHETTRPVVAVSHAVLVL